MLNFCVNTQISSCALKVTATSVAAPSTTSHLGSVERIWSSARWECSVQMQCRSPPSAWDHNDQSRWATARTSTRRTGAAICSTSELTLVGDDINLQHAAKSAACRGSAAVHARAYCSENCCAGVEYLYTEPLTVTAANATLAHTDIIFCNKDTHSTS